jgi:Zn-finger protein
MLGEECGGNFKYTHGIKDCSNCIITHMKDTGYDFVQQKMLTVIDIVQNEYLDKHKDKEKIDIK